MVFTEYRLEETRSTTLNASGEAEILGIGPARPNEVWKINLMSVKTSVEATFRVFRGYGTNDKDQIDYTQRGVGDISPCDITLQTGETISVKWTAGSNGATAVFRAEGSRLVPGKRSY